MTAGVWAPPSPASRFLDAGGVRLHLLDWGGEGLPAVFFPGIGQSAHLFRDLVPALGPGFRAVAVTPRGHGESDTPESGYTLARMAAESAAVMDSLSIARAAVVAHSLGGAVATRLAADAPERVSHVVYLDSLADYAELGRVQARSPARPPPAPVAGADAAARAWHRAYVYRTWNGATEADWLARPSAAVRAHRQELLADLVDDAARHPPPLAALRVPVLALMARETVESYFPWLAAGDPRLSAAEAYLREVRAPWRRAAADRLLREVPHARVGHIPGNHYFFLTAPERTAAEIRAFLLSS